MLTDLNGVNREINLSDSVNPSSALVEPGNKMDVSATAINNGGNIRFRVLFGSDNLSRWFDLGETRLIFNFATGKFFVAKPGTGYMPTTTANSTVTSSMMTVSALSTTDAVRLMADGTTDDQQLKALFNYLNAAQQSATFPSPNIFVQLLPNFLFLLIIFILWIFLMR